MSWLLVALVPALLMLATIGLSRLEAGLSRDAVTAGDVADFLTSAEAVGVGTLATVAVPVTWDDVYRRRAERIPEAAAVRAGSRYQAAQAFPERIGSSSTRRINRV